MNVSPLRRALGHTPGEAVRRITLITKPGCHLCDDARAVVEKVAAETSAEVEEINMLEHPDLVAKYAEQIPVTLVDGRQHDYWRVDEDRLRRAVTGGRRRR
ncbi:glutaredoxin family protein [Dermacoccus sp. GAS27A]|uniref:glutaredoxin family protein n=1 Tax=Dermacoccus sp. GAS27A TaxID=3156270 RepID=UPI003838DC46